jgi:hypothetical protein
MARWEPQASAEQAKGIMSSGVTAVQATELEQAIDNWANEIHADDPQLSISAEFDSPSGRGNFTAFALNQTVKRVEYSSRSRRDRAFGPGTLSEHIGPAGRTLLATC